jgi:hypothetical protein
LVAESFQGATHRLRLFTLMMPESWQFQPGPQEESNKKPGFLAFAFWLFRGFL